MFITLTELRYVVAIAQEKHFGRAAQKCFVSQPTLSIAIKKLEDNLGVTIFERNKTQVILTHLGVTLVNQAQQILDMVTEIEESAKYNNDELARPLKLGAIHTVGPYLFPKLITAIKKKASIIKLLIEEDFTNNLANKLLNGELDAIIVAEPFSKPNILTNHLYSEGLDIIIPTNHDWKARENISPDELSGQKLLLLGNGHCFRDQVLSICPKCVFNEENEDTQMIITSSIQTIKYMVGSDLGISIIPRNFTDDLYNQTILVKKFIQPTPKREIILAYRNSFSRKNLISQLVELIHRLKLSTI